MGRGGACLHRPLRGRPPRPEPTSVARHALRPCPHSKACTAEPAAGRRGVEPSAAWPWAVRSPSCHRVAPGARFVHGHGFPDQPTARKQRLTSGRGPVGALCTGGRGREVLGGGAGGGGGGG